jgi:hypothetical protein
VQVLQRTLEDIAGRQYVTEVVVGRRGGAGSVQFNYAGGPVTAGTDSFVGEIGRELWVPNSGSPRIIGADGPELAHFGSSGYIIPNNILEAATKATDAKTPRAILDAIRGQGDREPVLVAPAASQGRDDGPPDPPSPINVHFPAAPDASLGPADIKRLFKQALEEAERDKKERGSN